MAHEEEQHATNRWDWFHKLRRHPIFIVLVFVLASKIIGEFYPLSPFSMYSNPSSVPLRYYYVADGDGEPIPILWHSGQTPARLTKKYRAERGQIEQALEKSDGKEQLSDAEIRAEAGKIVLRYVIKLSHGRSKKRHLKPPLQLVEVAIHMDDDGKLHETPVTVAELKAELNAGQKSTP